MIDMQRGYIDFRYKGDWNAVRKRDATPTAEASFAIYMQRELHGRNGIYFLFGDVEARPMFNTLPDGFKFFA